jgi:hypothetical protein
MSYVMVDVESDGPIPGDYSMICFGAVVVRDELDQVYYGRLKPISEKWIPDALAVSGFQRVDTFAFDDPKTRSAIRAQTLARCTREWPRICSKTSNTCAGPSTRIIRLMTREEMLKRSWR